MPAYADNFLLKMKATDRKLFAILAPVIIGAVLGVNIFMKPLLKNMKSVETEKAGYSEKEAVYKNIIDWDKKLTPFRGQAGKESDKTALIDQLNSFASKSGLTILSISPDEKKVALSNIENMLIRIDSEGNYHQMAQFISLAESLKAHTRVTSLEINRDGIADIVPSGMGLVKIKTYKMSLSLTVYFGMKD